MMDDRAQVTRNTAKGREQAENGDAPMTEAQASRLRALCAESGERFDSGMTKAAASEMIDRLEAARPGTAGDAADQPSPGHEEVRPAGPGQMDMPPKSWTKTDEEVDESFPASDPPGNY